MKMKNGIVDKLSTYAALIGVIATIGGGFYAWGEFNTRLSSIEGSNVDIIRELMEMIMVQKGLELLGKAMNSGTKMLNAGMGVTDK